MYLSIIWSFLWLPLLCSLSSANIFYRSNSLRRLIGLWYGCCFWHGLSRKSLWLIWFKFSLITPKLPLSLDTYFPFLVLLLVRLFVLWYIPTRNQCRLICSCILRSHSVGRSIWWETLVQQIMPVTVTCLQQILNFKNVWLSSTAGFLFSYFRSIWTKLLSKIMA